MSTLGQTVTAYAYTAPAREITAGTHSNVTWPAQLTLVIR
jgi:hypothetical protein